MPRKPLAIHPFLFALWPVLFAYAQHIGVVSFSEAWGLIAALLGLALGTLIVIALILRSMSGAAAIVSLFFVLFFSYGHVHKAVWGGANDHVLTNESLLMMIVWAALLAGGAGLIIRAKERWSDITRILNVIGLTLVLISLVNIAIYHIKTQVPVEVALAPLRNLPQAEPEPRAEFPDIYYLIVDAYGGQEVLEEVYGFDNSEFLDFLKERGFFVAAKGRSNYCQTELSLASSLNLNYLDGISAAMGPDSNDRSPLRNLFQESTVTRFLREQGYRIIGLPSGFRPTTLEDSDGQAGTGHASNDLEEELLDSTPLPWLAIGRGLPDPDAAQRQRILAFFDLVADTTDLPSPRFVFGHSMATHVPYVFDEQGNESEAIGQFDMGSVPRVVDSASAERYRQGYVGQLVFANKCLELLIDELLSQASRPTIIILQADHGPDVPLNWENPSTPYPEGRFTILNAIRVPSDASIGLYDEITPVNTFRLIFNHYFGTSLEQLEDKSYYSPYKHPYRFTDVTEDVR